MTIPAAATEVAYAGDGVTLAFPIPYVFDTSADITVIETAADGTPAELTTGFSITGGGGSTGTCTFLVAPASGVTITLLDDPELTQTADYIANDAFPADAHEAALDRTVRQVKRLNRRVDRTLRVADGDNFSGDDLLLPVESARQGKFLAFDASGQPIASAGTGGGDSALRQDLANGAAGPGALLVALKRTIAEITAGVTPTVYDITALMPQISITRYGAVGDGVTDDSGAINKAIAVAKVFGGCVIVPPPSNFYLCTQTLDATFATGAGQKGIAFKGLGPACLDSPAIKFKHTGHGIDAAGARTIYFENIYFGTDAVTYPDVGLFLSRNSFLDSVIPQFGPNVGFVNNFSIAAIYNYGAETGIYSGLTIIQQASDANSKCVIITGTNIRGLTSLVAIPAGAQSCIDHRIDGGFFHHSGGGATHDCFEFESCDQVKISKAFAASFGATNGRSIVFVNMTTNASNYCDFAAVTWEQSGGPIQQYGVLFSNHVKTPIGWNFRGGVHAAGVAAIGTLGTNPTLNQFSMVRMNEPNNRGLAHPGGLVSDSTWESQALTFNVGTTRRNKLRGDFSQITWTTNDNSTFDDTSVTPTFVPNTAALAVVGALTKSGRVKYRGPHVIVSISLSAVTSINAAAGNVIPVPKTPGFVCASVKFINTTTGVQVNGGYISGAGIICPAFATGAGETMLIHAEYEPS